MKCPKCGADTLAGAVFCQKCGARLPAEATVGVSTATPLPGQSRIVGGGRAPIADVPEEILWQGGYSPKAIAGPAAVCGALTVVLIVASFFLGSSWWIPLVVAVLAWLALLLRLAARRLGVHYKLTNQRFFHQSGILRRVTNRVEVINIDDIAYEQGFIDRLVGVGRINISSHDRSDPKLSIEGIENVERVATLMDEARRAERLRRGVSVQSM
jgi:membrane protein YdbS with pleckstrin-like domain